MHSPVTVDLHAKSALSTCEGELDCHILDIFLVVIQVTIANKTKPNICCFFLTSYKTYITWRRGHV